MPLPIVKALYSVRENITLSNTSKPNHATAASAPLGYYYPMNRSEGDKLTLTTVTKS